ncbi:hypothetical protein AURDEDRAFT_170995 [Auricularia subglabra TFB-10046 SS5]|nr:hypothetical protein AURDEDRAFT_170995 [Auricularia subglabra TFB-10046 SS5]
MGRKVELTATFVDWAHPKLRSLVDAHGVDRQKGISREGEFFRLLKDYMEDYKLQPFAQPDYEGNPRNEDGSLKTFGELFKISERWFRNHSDMKKLAALTKYEEGDGKSDSIRDRAAGPSGLWAAVVANKERIHSETLTALGVTGRPKKLPSNYCMATSWPSLRKRKNVAPHGWIAPGNSRSARAVGQASGARAQIYHSRVLRLRWRSMIFYSGA